MSENDVVSPIDPIDPDTADLLRRLRVVKVDVWEERTLAWERDVVLTTVDCVSHKVTLRYNDFLGFEIDPDRYVDEDITSLIDHDSDDLYLLDGLTCKGVSFRAAE